jgi:hypothetical protein
VTASLVRHTTAEILTETARLAENSGLLTVDWRALAELLAYAAGNDTVYQDTLTALGDHLGTRSVWSDWLPEDGLRVGHVARDLRAAAEHAANPPTVHVVYCAVRACPGIRQAIAVDRLTAEVIVRGLPGWGVDAAGELTCPRPHGLLVNGALS